MGRAGRDEIWHYGLRNPWRFSFDRATGNMAIGDVGQGNLRGGRLRRSRAQGPELGWRCFEGFHPYADCNPPGHVLPAFEYSHGGGSGSVTGGYGLRDPSLASLAGRYVYGDYCPGALHAATVRNPGQTPRQRESVPRARRPAPHELRRGQPGGPLNDLARLPRPWPVPCTDSGPSR